jgi:hypothetical protein
MMDGSHKDQERPDRTGTSDDGSKASQDQMVRNEFRRRLLLGGAAATPVVLTIAGARRSLAAGLSLSCLEKNGAGILNDFETPPGTLTSRAALRTVAGLNPGDDFPAGDPIDNLIASGLQGGSCLASNGIFVDPTSV